MERKERGEECGLMVNMDPPTEKSTDEELNKEVFKYVHEGRAYVI